MMNYRATGRRVGRLVGEVDGLGLELATMEHAVDYAPNTTHDATELDYIRDAQRAQEQLAAALEVLVTHLNARDAKR